MLKYILESVNIVLLLCLCFLSTKSDLRTGRIKNKTLLLFLIAGFTVNIVYYGFCVRDLLFEYLLNVGIVSAISLCLFYSHSFAGGDCKLVIVLSILYPAEFYIVYGTTNITLFFTIGFAILGGYLYLVADSLWRMIAKRTHITLSYLKYSAIAFIKCYILATLYVFVIQSLLYCLNMNGISVNVWISRIICMAVAFCVGQFQVFKRKVLLIIVAVIDAAFAIALRILPFSINPEDYILAFVLLFCQMAAKTVIYKNIAATDLKKGMILSSMSTMLMQSSITKGLPKVSTEDLRSRLTGGEVESILIWARATKTETLVIVRKIPFAVFISTGFISYLLLWWIL